MILKHFYLHTLIITFIFSGCDSKSFGMFNDSDGIPVNRFDIALFQWIDTDDPELLQTVISNYPQMLAMLGNALFKTNHPDSSAFFNQLKNYYAEPALKSLYNDAISFYNANSPAFRQIESELSCGFAHLQSLLPSMQIPAVYLHVSGLQQNIIVADSLLSISIDKYLGTGYPLYQDFFYDYQLKSMAPECAAKDGLYAWLSSEYPHPEQERTLLDKMIYEGKIIYMLTQAGNKYSYQQIMSLTANEYKWHLKNEAASWKTMLERKHPDTTDAATISRYFQPAPSLFISEEAPGNIGNFIGYRIVAQYMKQTKSDCVNLMNNSNAQEILKKSKYKP